MRSEINTLHPSLIFYVFVPVQILMSRTISISDEVYRKLKREKGEKSFSEVILEKIESGGKISDVAGKNILTKDIVEKVKDDVENGSKVTEERIEDEIA